MLDDFAVEDGGVERCDVGKIDTQDGGEEAAVGGWIEKRGGLRVSLDKVFDRLGL